MDLCGDRMWLLRNTLRELGTYLPTAILGYWLLQEDAQAKWSRNAWSSAAPYGFLHWSRNTLRFDQLILVSGAYIHTRFSRPRHPVVAVTEWVLASHLPAACGSSESV